MSEDREISMGIVVNPNRMSGAPCIRGTRIPARMVADMVSGPNPMRAETIVEDYPSLSFADIVNAKLWAAKERQT